MNDGLESLATQANDGLGDLTQGSDEVVDINLSSSGDVLPPKNNKILLVDADTLIFSACLNCARVDELLPESMYAPEQYEELINNPTYDPETHSIQFVFKDEVDEYINSKLQYMMDMTGAVGWELHLTDNLRSSFRYRIYDMYKANRRPEPGDINRTPPDLWETKVRWVEENPTKVFIWDEWEADDMCVALKRDNPDKYILAAVDKDVLYSLPGKHWNYYTSAKYSIDMRWVKVDKMTAMRHHYIQTLTGDGTDNIPGLPQIGPKRAEKILADCEDQLCMWNRVVEAYEEKGKTVIDALITMRLVNMRQLVKDKNGEYKLELWKPPVGLTKVVKV